MSSDRSIRVLVVDDERAIRAAYCELLASPKIEAPSEAELLSVRLFNRERPKRAKATTFEVCTADRAEAALEAVRERLAAGEHFDVIFLDMRMPPGPDGAWAASKIREIDESVDIVIATAYSDVDPGEMAERIPPAERLFYLQKPFHAHYVRQLAVALGRRAQAEAQTRRLAYFDPLTGLPNRAQLWDQIGRAIAVAQRSGRQLAVMFADLDGFKRINDTLGHAFGDEVLCAVARRFREVVRDTDIVTRALGQVGRMGGDEFLFTLPEITGPDDAELVARRIASSLALPVRVAQRELFLTTSIGIALYPRDGDDIDRLLQNADLAMYSSKRAAGGSHAFYDASMSRTTVRQLAIGNQLRGAIDRDELWLEYQPLLELSSGRVTGVEALLRWTNPELGSVPPLEFIPVAEESQLITAIGDWVLRTACMEAGPWVAQGLIERISVNISSAQLASPDFTASVSRAIGRAGLEPRALELELTEGALIRDLDLAREMLEALKTLGVQIAIDDFGVGYSTMSHLKNLAIDRLKIDRSFVSGSPQNDRGRAIADAIISMARRMNLSVTAEGVEDEAELDSLAVQRCDEVQGFLVARPMRAEPTEAYLRALDRSGSSGKVPQ